MKKTEEEGERHKLYLFGEKKTEDDTEKLYVYGMSELRQDAKTFFGEYELLGTMQLREEERYVIPSGSGHASSILSDKGIRLEGFFVFYADNKAMQEFLISRHKNKQQEDKAVSKESGKIKRIRFNSLPAPDRASYTYEGKKREKDTIGSGLMLVCLTGMLCFLAATVFGKKYPQIMREMVPEIVSVQEETDQGDDLIIEEIDYTGIGETTGEETSEAIAVIEPQASEQGEETASVPEEWSENVSEEIQEEIPEETQEETQEEIQEEIAGKTQEDAQEEIPEEASGEAPEVTYTEYTVQEGDTLANICLAQYGTLDRMEEICVYNEISNADHIAPGEKIYLPD